MKKFLLSVAIAGLGFGVSAQNIKLPTPQKTGGKPLMEVLNERQSNRAFANKDLSDQTLSNLLWAAWGFNRENKRTAPSSRDRQEIDVYVLLKKGTYIYDAKANTLIEVSKKDLRSFAGTQEFVASAPVNLVYVCNKNKISGKDDQALIEATYANTGFIAQNVYLFCASDGLSCVIRAMIDKAELGTQLKLKKDQMITLSQTVGYPAK
ncbi:MAG: nitroreductase family protein [Tannerellaceae bacterium]